MSQLGRSAGLTGFVELAREAGLDPYRLAAEAGVPRAALTDQDMRVSSQAMSQLIEMAAEKSGLEDFGLRMAEKRRLSTMGPMGLAIRHQPTLRRGFEMMIAYGWIQNEALQVGLEDSGDVTLLRVSSAPWRGRVASELILAILLAIGRGLKGPTWRPLDVCFMHSAPASLDRHRRFFGVAPRFNQDFLGFVLERAELDAPIPGADPAMAEEAERYLELMSAGRALALKDKVVELLTLRLTERNFSVERVAQQLAIDRRTLHRRLAGEGTSYSELLASVRRDLAANLLATSDRPLYDIAESLGFASLSVFAHWFRRNFGCTASAYRSAHAGARPVTGVALDA